jgi:F0F1-type ATP synthase assembly protein I
LAHDCATRADYISTENGLSSGKDRRRAFEQLNLLSAGLLFPVSIVIGYGMGYLLDQWLGTTYLKIVFLLFGIAAGFVSFFRTISRLGKHDDQ